MITAVAIRDPEGRVHSLPKPNRPSDLIKHMIHQGVRKVSSQYEQGFLTEDGRFLNRFDAAKHVVLVQQSLRSKTRSIHGLLFSEDVW
mgnify:FL=1